MHEGRRVDQGQRRAERRATPPPLSGACARARSLFLSGMKLRHPPALRPSPQARTSPARARRRAATCSRPPAAACSPTGTRAATRARRGRSRCRATSSTARGCTSTRRARTSSSSTRATRSSRSRPRARARALSSYSSSSLSLSSLVPRGSATPRMRAALSPSLGRSVQRRRARPLGAGRPARLPGESRQDDRQLPVQQRLAQVLRRRRLCQTVREGARHVLGLDARHVGGRLAVRRHDDDLAALSLGSGMGAEGPPPSSPGTST